MIMFKVSSGCVVKYYFVFQSIVDQSIMNKNQLFSIKNYIFVYTITLIIIHV